MSTENTSSASLRSSIHSLRIRMTSYQCNKYEQITPSYLLSVNWTTTHTLGTTTHTLVSAREPIISVNFPPAWIGSNNNIFRRVFVRRQCWLNKIHFSVHNVFVCFSRIISVEFEVITILDVSRAKVYRLEHKNMFALNFNNSCSC